jgi:hypothetical protein
MASIVGAAEEQKSFGSFLQKRTFFPSLKTRIANAGRATS